MIAAAALLLCIGPLFQAPARYSVSAGEALLLADLNGDGMPEILTSGNSVAQHSAFSLLQNYGNGTFAPEQLIATEPGEKVEDFDGFLVASNYWRNGIVIDGVFHETATHGGPTRIADYDRDGIDDVVSFSFGSANPVRVHLFRGRGDGTFEAKKTFETRLDVAASPSMRMHDGAIEFVAGDRSGRLNLFRITAGGVSTSTLAAGPEFDLAAIFADVNGDGVADIVDANESGGVFVTLASPQGDFSSACGSGVSASSSRRNCTPPTSISTGVST